MPNPKSSSTNPISHLPSPKIAIVCDWLIGGGSERVIEALHKQFPDTPIFASYCSDEWRKKLDNQVVTGYLQHQPFAKLRKFLPLLRYWWYRSLNFDEFDIVISCTGNGEAKAIRIGRSEIGARKWYKKLFPGTRSQQSTPNSQLPTPKHVCYCYTPVHYYWRHYNTYLKSPGFDTFNWLARIGLKLLVGPMRRLDYKAAQKPDQFIAISKHIQGDIKQFYNRDSVVIHPPVNTQQFSKPLSPNSQLPTPRHGLLPLQVGKAQGAKENRKGDVQISTSTATRSSQHSDLPASSGGVNSFAVQQTGTVQRTGFLTVGRQTPYKRTDIIIKACNQLKLPLTVVGRGPEHDKLVKIAGPTIKFDTNASDEDVVLYMQSAEAFIFAAEEDFGITPVEAMAAGTPVIAYKAGGALDYVVEGKTGLFFDKQTSDSLADTLRNFSQSAIKPEACRTKAEEFSTEVFKEKLSKFIQSIT